MMQTQSRTLAMVDFEIDKIKPRARAEAALDAIMHSENFWRGSTAQLGALALEREQLALAAHGRLLLAAIAERAHQRAEYARLDSEHELLAKKLADAESTPLIARWKAAPAIARAGGYGSTFENGYVRWVVGTTGFGMRNASNAPVLARLNLPGVRAWSDAVLFELDDERAEIRRFYELERDTVRIAGARSDAAARIADIEKRYPEIAVVP